MFFFCGVSDTIFFFRQIRAKQWKRFLLGDRMNHKKVCRGTGCGCMPFKTNPCSLWTFCSERGIFQRPSNQTNCICHIQHTYSIVTHKRNCSANKHSQLFFRHLFFTNLLLNTNPNLSNSRSFHIFRAIHCIHCFKSSNICQFDVVYF